MSISVTPIPRLVDLAAPAFTLGTANAAGSAETAVASDSTLLAFDTTLPAAVGTAATGSATVATRRDHVHAGTTLSTPALTLGTTNGAGSATSAFATDSTILAFDATVPATVSTNATGSATVAARRDHVHTGTVANPVAANFAFGPSDSTNAGVHYRGGTANITIGDNESFTFTMPTGASTSLFTLADINAEKGALFFNDHANNITKVTGDALFVIVDGGSGGAATIAVVSGAGSRVTTITNRRNSGTALHLEVLGKVASATAVA